MEKAMNLPQKLITDLKGVIVYYSQNQLTVYEYQNSISLKYKSNSNCKY